MTVVLGILGAMAAFAVVLVVAITAILTTSLAYSYRVWKADPNKRDRQDLETPAA